MMIRRQPFASRCRPSSSSRVEHRKEVDDEDDDEEEEEEDANQRSTFDDLFGRLPSPVQLSEELPNAKEEQSESVPTNNPDTVDFKSPELYATGRNSAATESREREGALSNAASSADSLLTSTASELIQAGDGCLAMWTQQQALSSEAALVAKPVVENEVAPNDFGPVYVHIDNILCNFHVPCHLNLRRLAMCTVNVIYVKGASFLEKQKSCPQCKVRVFNSGKVVIIGVKSGAWRCDSVLISASSFSERKAQMAAASVMRTIRRSCPNQQRRQMKALNFQISNVMATVRLPFGIDYDKLLEMRLRGVSYEPELNTTLIWHYQQPKLTLNVRRSGCVTLLGGRSEADVCKVMEEVLPILRKCGCGSTDVCLDNDEAAEDQLNTASAAGKSKKRAVTERAKVRQPKQRRLGGGSGSLWQDPTTEREEQRGY